MAEEGTLCVRADVLEECGANANATYTAEAYTNKYIKKAESFICAQARYDYVTNYASVSTIGKEFLRDIASCYAAIKCIKQDMSGFFSRVESQVMLDVLWSSVVEGINLLRDDNYRIFVLSGSQ
jgi:hypothetical protein